MSRSPAPATATAPASSRLPQRAKPTRAAEPTRATEPTEPTERGVAGLRPWSDHLTPGDRRTAADLAAEGTLVHAFLRRWAEAPNAPLWLEAGRDGRRWWTNAAFEDATRRAAARLIVAGLEQGDRIVWSTAPSVDALVAHVACLRAGLVVVPVNPAYSQPELASVVAVTLPRGAILDSDEQARWVREAATEDIVVTGADVDLPDGPAEVVDRVGPDDPALIGMTSGTTAAPKGALLCHRHLLAATESLRWAWRWAPDDRLVHSLPLFHSHGLCVGAYGTMLSGGSAVLLGGFDPARVGEAARQESATMFFGVPTMYHRLVTSGAATDLRGLRLCVSGSAPMSAALHAEASAALGSPVLERYGMTETLMITSNPYDGERRAGTVGYPLPGVEVRLDMTGSSHGDEEDEEDGEIGEVLVRGPNVFDGYVGNPAATTDAFVEAEDGGQPWFRTGDLGVVERRQPGHPRTIEGAHHLRWLQRVPRRGGGGSGPLPGCGGGGRVRDALGRMGRGGDGLGGGRRPAAHARGSDAVRWPHRWLPTSDRGWSTSSTRCPATPWASWCAASSGPSTPVISTQHRPQSRQPGCSHDGGSLASDA